MTLQPRHRRRARKTLALLEAAYPDARCALRFDTPWQLLVATILSAQCTDTRVNQVTPTLFQRFPGPGAMAEADPAEIREIIRTTGFFRNKADHLQKCARHILAEHEGAVPRTMDELVALPGVGRKTANVILGNAFGRPGMVVDTHVGRVARRLGWAEARQPERVEKELCDLLPKEKWTQTSHVLIFHGRQCCRAQTAWCSRCPVVEHCPQIGVDRQK